MRADAGLRWAATLLVIWMGGCTGSRAIGREGVLTPSPHPYESDIPLPVGFVLADQSSEDWSSGSIRYLRHRYIGRADKYAVRRFYRKQMPLVRWTAVSNGHIQGRCTLCFQRGQESCTITIEDDGRKRSGRVVVEATIAPDVG